MAISVTCEKCGATYNGPDESAGQVGRCRCGSSLRVPGTSPIARPGGADAHSVLPSLAPPPSGAPEPEGCLRVLVALVVGAAGSAFIVLLIHLIASVFIATANPVTVFNILLAGMGALAGVLAACLAPVRRWQVAAPLVVLLEAGSVAAFLLLGASLSEAMPRNMLTYVVFGIPLGLASVCLCSHKDSARRRGLVAAMVVVGILLALGFAHLSGVRSLALIKRDILPSVEAFVRTEVLAKSGPVRWEELRWTLWSSGVPFVWAHGAMVDPPVGLFFSFGTPHRVSGSPGQPQGLCLDGLEIYLSQARNLTMDEERNTEIVRAMLKSMGLRPELADQFTPSGSSTRAVYHGVTYYCSHNQSNAFGVTSSSTVLRCGGTLAAP